MLSNYKVIDTVRVETLEKGDIFEWDGQVYTVDVSVNDEGFSDVAVCITDEMGDDDILWLEALIEVDLLMEDFD